MRQYGVQRIVLANQLIGKSNVKTIVSELNADDKKAFEANLLDDSASYVMVGDEVVITDSAIKQLVMIARSLAHDAEIITRHSGDPNNEVAMRPLPLFAP